MKIVAGVSFAILALSAGCAPTPAGIEGPCPVPPELTTMPATGGEEAWFEDTSNLVLAYATELSGFDESAATACVAEADLVWRVVARDGEFFAVTADYVPTRVNAVIERSIVADVTVG